MGSMAKRYRSLPFYDRDVQWIHNKLFGAGKREIPLQGKKISPPKSNGPHLHGSRIYNALALAAAKRQSQAKQVSPQQQDQSEPSSTVAPGTLNATTAPEVEQEIKP